VPVAGGVIQEVRSGNVPLPSAKPGPPIVGNGGLLGGLIDGLPGNALLFSPLR
jgi:hypothetical protein